jgi:hypothetical protein
LNVIGLDSALVRIKERLFYQRRKSTAVLSLIVTNIAIDQGQIEMTQTDARHIKYLA